MQSCNQINIKVRLFVEKMDGDWEEVKKPVKKAKPQQHNEPHVMTGGKKGKNVLVAGAVQPHGRYGGPGAYSNSNAAAG